jgi:hypothetical protein
LPYILVVRQRVLILFGNGRKKQLFSLRTSPLFPAADEKLNEKC